MGVNASALAKEQANLAAAPLVKGHYVSDIKTGFRWATDPIVSDSSVTKKPLPFSLPNLPGEEWGPYQKKFTTTSFGGKVFYAPETVDGVPILCRCREISDYVRGREGGRIFNAEVAILGGKHPPACWEDDYSVWNPSGGMTFKVKTREPQFYTLLANRDGAFGIVRSMLGGIPAKPVQKGKHARIQVRAQKGQPTRKQTRTPVSKRKGKQTRKQTRKDKV